MAVMIMRIYFSGYSINPSGPDSVLVTPGPDYSTIFAPPRLQARPGQRGFYRCQYANNRRECQQRRDNISTRLSGSSEENAINKLLTG